MVIDGHRMERLLEVWEDAWQLFFARESVRQLAVSRGQIFRSTNPNLDALRFSKESPAHHWREFREYLQQNTGRFDGTSAYLDTRFHCGLHEWSTFQALDVIAADLHGWCMTSKRVFYLERDLQILLGAMSTGLLTWSDVILPFPCFAIMIADPIVHESKLYDMLVVRHFEIKGEGPRLGVTIVPQAQRSYRPMTTKDRGNIREAINAGNTHGAADLVSNQMNVTFELLPKALTLRDFAHIKLTKLFTAQECEREVKKDSGLNFNEEVVVTMNKVMRIIAGLCLYLKTLPSSSPLLTSVSQEAKASTRMPVIASRQDLLAVLSDYRLTDVERAVFSNTDNEIGREGKGQKRGPYQRPRYRRGFWHRPRGKGHDPLFPKIEKTKPTICRRDLLAKGILPAGAQTTV